MVKVTNHAIIEENGHYAFSKNSVGQWVCGFCGNKAYSSYWTRSCAQCDQVFDFPSKTLRRHDLSKDSWYSHDAVNHPSHYTSHPSGIECIQITEHMNFCVGNAVKYLWRADLKNGVEDLEKAKWYIEREIQRRQHAN